MKICFASFVEQSLSLSKVLKYEQNFDREKAGIIETNFKLHYLQARLQKKVHAQFIAVHGADVLVLT